MSVTGIHRNPAKGEEVVVQRDAVGQGMPEITLSRSEYYFLVEPLSELLRRGDGFCVSGVSIDEAEGLAEAVTWATVNARVEAGLLVSPGVVDGDPRPRGFDDFQLDIKGDDYVLRMGDHVASVLICCLARYLPLRLPLLHYPGRSNDEAYEFFERMDAWARDHGIDIPERPRAKPEVDPIEKYCPGRDAPRG